MCDDGGNDDIARHSGHTPASSGAPARRRYAGELHPSENLVTHEAEKIWL